jgi:tetratricopeptide (TPR) repeat protein/tRNA A-37 threonylcarbamoyl transferase component Bud32
MSNDRRHLDLIAQARRQVEQLDGSQPLEKQFLRGYELIREIHRGGQGVVYLAHHQATRRDVAVKLLREGPFAGTAERARFEREVHVLASIKHPHIVAIHDSGVACGCFYYVMDYIPGLPLDAWADHVRRSAEVTGRRSSTGRERSRLERLIRPFIKISEAVNAAHRRGIIHRDLKPTNIRIGDDNEPFVLDFGLAKLASSDADTNETPDLTATGQFLGTIHWASPEQVAGTSGHADIRSDVYALGLMLYRALTGRMPYQIGATLPEMIRVITQAEPSQPSVVTKDVDRDLETIVLKCLSKDPDRRYQTAGDLSDDLRRYLGGEPIAARRDSGWYLLRMFAHRHRWAVGVTTAFVALLAASSLTMAYLYSKAKTNAALAIRRADEIRQIANFQASMLGSVDVSAMGSAILAEMRNQVRAGLESTWIEGDGGKMRKRTTDEVQAALARFDDCTQPANFADVARHVLDVGFLASAKSAIGKDFANQPQSQASLLLTLGNAYRTLGDFDSAESCFRSALGLQRSLHGEQHPDVADVMQRLADALSAKGDYQTAEVMIREALAMCRSDDAKPLRATILNELGEVLVERGNYDEAERSLRESLRLRRELHGDRHESVARALHDLAMLASVKGDLPAGESLHREALQMNRQLLGDDHPDTLTSVHNLAAILFRRGEYPEAEKLYREALAAYRKLYGNEHPNVAVNLTNLSAVMSDQGDLDEAERLIREGQAVLKRLGAEKRPEFATNLNNLAIVLVRQGDAEEAEECCRRALELRRALVGDGHADVGMTLNNLAMALGHQDDLIGAERAYHEALELFRGLPGPEHPLMGYSLVGLGWALLEQDRLDDAEPYLREGIALWERVLRADHPSLAYALCHLARLLYLREDTSEAEATYRRALAICQEKLPPGHLVVGNCQTGLGLILTGRGDYADAEQLLLDANKVMEQNPTASEKNIRRHLEALVELYEAWDREQSGQGFDAKAAQWRTRLEQERNTKGMISRKGATLVRRRSGEGGFPPFIASLASLRETPDAGFAQRSAF